MNTAARRVERHTYTDADFQPVVETAGWLVALMNWSPRFDLSGWGELERHPHTDEVFVLLKGEAILFVDGDAGLECLEMAHGVVYNVTAATWHNVIGSRDVQWLIVESKPDASVPTEYRTLSTAEQSTLRAAFPPWLGAEVAEE